MREQLKKKLSVGISIFLILALVLSVLPQTAVSVQAATVVSWYDLETETSISVEKGAKFYIGDYVMVLGKRSHATGSMVNASYKSSDTKIATVNQKGYLKAKKAGMTEITVVCQGKTLTCHLTVESKGTFGDSKQEKNLRSAIKTLTKGMPAKKLSTGKAYSFITKYRKFMNSYYQNSVTKLSYDGFLYQNDRPASEGVDESKSDRLAVPEAGRFWTADALVRQFELDNEPTSAESKKTIKIKTAKISSKSNKITVQLTKAVTEAQILAAQLTYSDYNVAAGSRKTAEITISVYDETARVHYKGKATLKKGSKQVTIQPSYYRGLKYHNADVIKGHVYRIGSALDWGNGKKVTAK